MTNSSTNLRVLEKTKRKPESGDIFVFQLVNTPDRYFFGRVVATDTTIGGITEFGVVLIYLYRTSSPDKLTIPDLKVSDLLVPPIGTNTVPWTKGYFELVQQGQNKAEDLLPQHCFFDLARRCYFDEYGNRLPGNPTGPVGNYGLSGIGSIDIQVSKALGMELSQ
jgi:hypothetical protein